MGREMKEIERWEKQPIYNVIYSIVKEKKTVTFKNLVAAVKETLNDADEERIRTALMKLEIWDKVIVVSDGTQKRIIYKG
jgi:hypothetical protein